MEAGLSRSSWKFTNPGSRLHTLVLVCAVAALSYIAARLGATLVLYPSMLSPLWPGLVPLVAVLLLVRRRMWAMLIAAALAAFVLSDLQSGLPVHSIVWLIPGSVTQILTAALCLRYFFDGVPRFDGVKALVKYSLVAVILAPFIGAFIGAPAFRGEYWTSWKIIFSSQAIAFLTLMPAVLGWLDKGPAWRQKSPAYYAETAALNSALALLGYITFVAPGRSVSPSLIFSLVPFLLWSALRFGSMGVSTSVVLIAFLSIWGAVHGSGPFSRTGQLDNVLSLQLFLLLSAAPFMVLAALVEERKRAEKGLRESEEKFRSVFLDAGIGMTIVSPEGRFLACNEAFSEFIGYTEQELLHQTVQSVTHPEDWPAFSQKLTQTLTSGSSFRQVEKRCLHKDGRILWGECSASLIRNSESKPLYFVGEVLDMTERRRAVESLRESEERFRLVANSAPVLIWMSGTDKQCNFFNKSWLDFTGRSLEQEVGEGWASGVHPDDLERSLGIYSAAFDARVEFKMEYRLRRFDGKYRWIVDYGVPRFESDGTFLGYIGSCVDITERRLSEEALLDMSGRLIAAHEEERARIARELHDDLSQRMALLQIGLEQFEQQVPRLSPKSRQQLRKIAEVATEVSSDIHGMSHQLHPSKLDTLGLVAGVRGFCRELSKQHGMQIEFIHQDVPPLITKDVTLCLFRIVQEGLRNVVKHSGTTKARLELTGYNDKIHLCISDSGRGFNPESVNGKAGLGLISMRERLRLLGGHLSVVSEPSHGTRICVSVLLSKADVQGASERQTRSAGA